MHINARILFVCLYFCIRALGNCEKNGSVFVPTREWQTVKKGTPLPAGLHVRHNFETGVTEAKLMDEAETNDSDNDIKSSNSKSLTLHPDKSLREPEDQNTGKIIKESQPLKFPLNELKARLKNLKSIDKENTSSDKNEPGVKRKFKSYETLKKELGLLKANVTSDAELLQGFFQKFQSHKNSITSEALTPVQVDDVLDILNNMEYLIHQIDNAHTFTDMDGMTMIILPCLNSTNNQIKAEALRLLGAAVQSNPKVQIKALENDFVQKLLHMLSTNSQEKVKSRCLFALSALVRHFPAAQKALVEHGGLEMFGKILAHGQLQVQTKVLTLINDLTIERQDLSKINDLDQRQRKAREYAITDFEQKLIAHEYCQHLSVLMVKTLKQKLEEVSAEEHDFVHVLLESMITLNTICKNEFLLALDDILSLYEKYSTSKKPSEKEAELVLLEVMKMLIDVLKKSMLDIYHNEL